MNAPNKETGDLFEQPCFGPETSGFHTPKYVEQDIQSLIETGKVVGQSP